MELGAIRSAHIVGIGGSGVSAVARYLASTGVAVTGSDSSAGPLVEALRHAGIKVVLGHAAANLPAAADAAIYSTAVPDDSPELVAARQRGIPTYSYPQVLGRISAAHRTLAVAGTNGKSTTAALLASILEAAGRDPLAIIGAQLAQWNGSNYRAGAGDFVIEACEHQAHFLELRPFAACITNVAEDHLDFYGDLAAIEAAFTSFVRKLPAGGVLVYNADDHAASSVAAASGHASTTSYSALNQDADLAAANIDQRVAARLA
jgi:UDP-N-acetylmuramate--alanine ligase